MKRLLTAAKFWIAFGIPLAGTLTQLGITGKVSWGPSVVEAITAVAVYLVPNTKPPTGGTP